MPPSPGKTLRSGFQVGVRRTLPIPAERAWNIVTSPRGLRIWLGRVGGRRLKPGISFDLADGTRCRLRVLNPDSHLRLGWHPLDWPRSSTIQVRVIFRGERCVLAFHQEGPPGACARLERGIFYPSAMLQLQDLAARMASPRSHGSPSRGALLRTCERAGGGLPGLRLSLHTIPTVTPRQSTHM